MILAHPPHLLTSRSRDAKAATARPLAANEPHAGSLQMSLAATFGRQFPILDTPGRISMNPPTDRLL
ncbi:hypothetical protein N7524_011834 [Penicillium chrysogenum]|nr:hypothetical protein N7524_011834 [Penicillium chrysogenum]